MTDQKMDTSQAANCDRIPIIDLTSLDSSDAEARGQLARNIYDACTQVGFFYIKNHGIPEEMINGLHNAAENFFALPEDQKMRLYIGNSQKFRGYSPIGGEKTTGTEDDPISASEATGVLSEAFDIGYETAMDTQKAPGASLGPDPYGMLGENQWPDEEMLAGFKETYIQYCATLLEFCRKLMRIIAIALDVSEDYFDGIVRDPGVTSRLMHYPAQKGSDPREGLGAHTDWECFTILSQGKVPGLQVLNQKGEWILAPPLPGTLVVNIADCLSTWTNKNFKSTIHRVTNISGEERYSIPFFFGIDYNATVSVLDNHTSEDNPPCRAPFKAGEWVREKMSKAYVGYEG